MTQTDLLDSIAAEYTHAGYEVFPQPKDDDLPDFLKYEGIDLIARNGTETIAVQVKARNELKELPSGLSKKFEGRPGWRYEIVVPPLPNPDELPAEKSLDDVTNVYSLCHEGSQALFLNLYRAAFVLAWSAAESAMRLALNKEGDKQARPWGTNSRFLLKNLYARGMLTQDELNRLETCSTIRNQLAHGFLTEDVPRDQIIFLFTIAWKLLGNEGHAVIVVPGHHDLSKENPLATGPLNCDVAFRPAGDGVQNSQGGRMRGRMIFGDFLEKTDENNRIVFVPFWPPCQVDEK